MQFQYIAKTLSGESAIGRLEAGSSAEAATLLRHQGLFALSIVEDSTDAGLVRNSFGRSRKISKLDVLMLTSQLAIMCRAGVDLAEAFQGAANQCRNPSLRAVLEDVYHDIEEGKPTSIALKRHSSVFGDTYVAAIAAGEASGRIPEVLSRLAELLRNEIRLRSTLRSVMAYPLVLGIVTSCVLAALVFFVLPRFAQVFDEVGIPAPPLTRMLLDTAQWIRQHLMYVLVGAGLGVATISQWLRSAQAQRSRDTLLLNVFPFRNSARPILAGRTFRLLGTMLQSGIPVLEALKLCGGAVRNYHYRELFQELERDVLNGTGLARTLSSTSFIPHGAAQMTATAERSGNLGTVLQTIGEFYEDEGERQLRELSKLVEPAIIVLMGIVVAAVVMSIMLPLLDFSTMSS